MIFRESINRTTNLLGVAIVGLSGLAFFPEVFSETEWPFKMDDIFLFVLGIIAVGWYVRGKNKFSRSIFPIVITVLAGLIKFAAIFIELHDKEDVGDDFGGVILFILAAILLYYQYQHNPKIKESN